MNFDSEYNVDPENSFSVTLLSNGSADIYPNNSLSSFTNKFPKKIDYLNLLHRN